MLQFYITLTVESVKIQSGWSSTEQMHGTSTSKVTKCSYDRFSLSSRNGRLLFDIDEERN